MLHVRRNAAARIERVVFVKLLIILNIFVVEVSFSQHVVFPLQVGDRWHYHAYHHTWFDSLGYETRVAGDTTFPNGKTYAICRDGYLRQEAESVYVYYPSMDSERILYQFNWAAADTACWPNSPCEMAQSLTGRKLRIFHFIDGILGMGADVADSLGIVAYYYYYYPDNLVGAVIDGVTYGTVDDVRQSRTDLPNSVNLYQNFPNPFNPSTSISYSLSERGLVNLAVFDLFGRQVYLLVNEIKNPGRYSITWIPDAISSGLYFYQLHAGPVFQIKHMLYVK